ncbi:MAG: cobalt-precorrin-5B (C(1))-methyltransferase, partial [Oscillospiraceae bacterium]
MESIGTLQNLNGSSPLWEGPFFASNLGGGTVARLEEYLTVGQKRLRCGYTTGTCAAAAARGAAELLLRGTLPPSVRIETPAGIAVE